MQKSKELQSNCRSSRRSCSIKIGVLKNFTKFTEKHLCRSLFYKKVAVLIFIEQGEQRIQQVNVVFMVKQLSNAVSL